MYFLKILYLIVQFVWNLEVKEMGGGGWYQPPHSSIRPIAPSLLIINPNPRIFVLILCIIYMIWQDCKVF